MPANDFIYLRFHGDQPGSIPLIEVQELSTICRQLCKLVESVCGAGKANATARLVFGDSPREGSLVISLVPEISVTAYAYGGVAASLVASLPVEQLWQFVFGRNGVFDQIRRGLGRPSTTDPMPGIGLEKSSLAISITEAAMASPDVVEGVRVIIESVEGLHRTAVDVTIEVRYEGEMTLRSGADIVPHSAPLVGLVTPKSIPHGVMLKGKMTTAVHARHDGPDTRDVVLLGNYGDLLGGARYVVEAHPVDRSDVVFSQGEEAKWPNWWDLELPVYRVKLSKTRVADDLR